MEHREFLEMVRAIEGRGDLDEDHALIEHRFELDKNTMQQAAQLAPSCTIRCAPSLAR